MIRVDGEPKAPFPGQLAVRLIADPPPAQRLKAGRE